jgi:hypothetical protein
MNSTTNFPQKRTAFAPITDALDHIARQVLKPCDYWLWRYLRRKNRPGEPVEFDLDDFISEYGYSLKWAGASLQRLIKEGWVEMVRRFYGHGYRVIVHEPTPDTPPPPDSSLPSSPSEIGNFTSSQRNSSSTNFHSTSQKQPSNPHSFVTNNKEFKEITNIKPTHHPVDVAGIDREVQTITAGSSQVLDALTSQSLLPDPQTLAPANQDHEQLLTYVRDAIAPAPLNPKIQALVLGHSAQTVKDAVEALREQREKKPIKNIAGFLVNAIKGRWKPNHLKAATNPIQRLHPLPTGDEVGNGEGIGERAAQDVDAGNLLEEEDQPRQQQHRNNQRPEKWEPTPPPLFVPQDWQREAVDQMHVTADHSDGLAMVQVHIKRLGWGRERVTEFLKDRYGVISRALLSGEQIEDMARYLASL